MRRPPTIRHKIAATAVVVVGLLAPVMINGAGASGANTIETGVAEMAAAKQTANRTGVVSLTNGVPTTTTTTTTLPPQTGSDQAQEILALVNMERTARGLQPVKLESRLNTAAQKHTVEQAASGDIYHYAADGTGPGDRISAAGYRFSTWGENVAAGQRNAEAVMEAWMNSPGHCRNILDPGYTELGIGYTETETSYRLWWTQKFARPSGAERPPGTYDPAWC